MFMYHKNITSPMGHNAHLILIVLVWDNQWTSNIHTYRRYQLQGNEWFNTPITGNNILLLHPIYLCKAKSVDLLIKSACRSIICFHKEMYLPNVVNNIGLYIRVPNLDALIANNLRRGQMFVYVSIWKNPILICLHSFIRYF